jgi:hypothetical protein
MSRSSQSNIVSVNNKLIGALEKYLPKKPLALAGKTWSTPELVAAFTGENNAIAASTSAKAACVAAIATVNEDRATNDVLRAALHQAVLLQFGPDPTVLAAFGYATPRKRGPASPEAKLIAAAKRAATRKALGTLGSKQRKALRTALVTPFAVTVTPTATAAAAAPAVSAPAASAPGAAPIGTTTQK